MLRAVDIDSHRIAEFTRRAVVPERHLTADTEWGLICDKDIIALSHLSRVGEKLEAEGEHLTETHVLSNFFSLLAHTTCSSVELGFFWGVAG